MKDCSRCIMEYADGIILIEPNIYIIEGNFTSAVQKRDDKELLFCSRGARRGVPFLVQPILSFSEVT